MKLRHAIFATATAVAAVASATVGMSPATAAIAAPATTAAAKAPSLEFVGQFIIKNRRLGPAWCMEVGTGGTIVMTKANCPTANYDSANDYPRWNVATDGVNLRLTNIKTDTCLDYSPADGLRAFLCNGEYFQQWLRLGGDLFGGGDGLLQTSHPNPIGCIYANTRNRLVQTINCAGGDTRQIWTVIEVNEV
jgi:hypothetical protein